MFLSPAWSASLFVFISSFSSAIAADGAPCPDELRAISILFYPKHPGEVPPSHIKLKIVDRVVSSDRRKPARFDSLVRRAERRGGSWRFYEIEWQVPQSKIDNLKDYLEGECTQGMGCASFVSNALWHSKNLKIPFPFNRSPLLIFWYLRVLNATGILSGKVDSYGRIRPRIWSSHTVQEVFLILLIGAVFPRALILSVQNWEPGIVKNLGDFIATFGGVFGIGFLLGGHYVHLPVRHRVSPPPVLPPEKEL